MASIDLMGETILLVIFIEVKGSLLFSLQPLIVIKNAFHLNFTQHFWSCNLFQTIFLQFRMRGTNKNRRLVKADSNRSYSGSNLLNRREQRRF